MPVGTYVCKCVRVCIRICVCMCVHTVEQEIFAEENSTFSPEMQFSRFYFRFSTATVRVGSSLDEFLCGEIFVYFDQSRITRK